MSIQNIRMQVTTRYTIQYVEATNSQCMTVNSYEKEEAEKGDIEGGKVTNGGSILN